MERLSSGTPRGPPGDAGMTCASSPKSTSRSLGNKYSRHAGLPQWPPESPHRRRLLYTSGFTLQFVSATAWSLLIGRSKPRAPYAKSSLTDAPMAAGEPRRPGRCHQLEPWVVATSPTPARCTGPSRRTLPSRSTRQERTLWAGRGTQVLTFMLEMLSTGGASAANQLFRCTVVRRPTRAA